MNTPSELQEPISITKASQSWMQFYARRVSGVQEAQIPKTGTPEEVLEIAKEIDPKIAERDGTIHLIKNLRAVETGRQGVLYLSDEILTNISIFRQRLEATLNIAPESEQYAEAPAEQENRANTWLSHMLSEHYEDLQTNGMAKLSEKEKQARMLKAMTAMQYAPLELLLHSYAENGRHQLNNIKQSTRAESLKYATSGSDNDEAEQAGYPLPTEKILQKDFLQIEKRKEKLQELREKGDKKEIALYEADCARAIYAAFMGFRQPDSTQRKWQGNWSIPDIANTNVRDCGGAAIQSIHWFKELGIKTMMATVLESPFMVEGHVSMIVIDAEGTRHFFDPALRKPYSPIPEKYYIQENIDRLFEEVDNGKRKRFRLDVVDPQGAYIDVNAPHTIIHSVEEGLNYMLQYWSIFPQKNSDAKRAQIAMNQKIAGNHQESDGVSQGILSQKIHQLANDDNAKEIIELTNMIVERFPDSMSALKYAGLAYNEFGDVKGAIEVMRILMKKINQGFKYMNLAIKHLEKTVCVKGKNITRGLARHLEILSEIEMFLDLIVVLIWNLKSKEGHWEIVKDIVQDMTDMIFKIYLEQTILLNQYTRERTGSSEWKETETSIGKVMIAYTRVQESFRE